MDDAPLGRSSELADAALANLVDQFARPLDCLRELVQNSIDAGTPRIEVTLRHVDGVLQIHVDDFGDGMDEHILDNQLTRLFSSTKEDDLTKIGKFGIGFTSIFAIRPDAVLLHTGRHGESWELLFHADRSYDKVRLDRPVEGTKITLFKRMPADEVAAFVREARWVLTYWCEHSQTPIHFFDRTTHPEDVAPEDDDVFAAFEAPGPTTEATPSQVNSPLALEAELRVEHVEDDLHVLVGYAESPSYGFYNGGLTLVNTSNPDVLGEFGERFAHLAFKLRCDALEHTLTRDNVLRDAHWEAAMEALERAARVLRSRLLDRVEEAASADEDLDRWHHVLARECRGSQLHTEDRHAFQRLLLRDLSGERRTLRELAGQGEDLDGLLVSSGQPGLDEALAAEGLVVLPDRVGTRALLQATLVRAPGLFRRDLEVTAANTLFVLPQIVRPTELREPEERLLQATRRLLRATVGRRITLEVGDFGGERAGRAEALVLEGPRDGRVFQRPEESWFRLPRFLRRRCLLLNRHHPWFRLQVAASVEDAALAAFSLAQALLAVEGVEGERSFARLTRAAVDGLSA